ncbi:unnamed protein product [Ostreobium quekettii]|uniref:Leucine aminopeptidase n=1 Tax=Ostreobium quekettii TaxID=121088 RepID=A0A8S1JBG0_9CHLO|nr:unnamed protein product [Ostreobium quekettii]
MRKRLAAVVLLCLLSGCLPVRRSCKGAGAAAGPEGGGDRTDRCPAPRAHAPFSRDRVCAQSRWPEAARGYPVLPLREDSDICSAAYTPVEEMAEPDPVSQSNFRQIHVTHSDYELDIDFAALRMEGFVQLTAVVKEDGCTKLVLDTRDLTIIKTCILPSKCEKGVDFSIGSADKVLGSSLTVELPDNLTKGQQVVVGVHFKTSPESTAMQWLEPAQTAGGTHPYLFTQCQAIHARSFVPCQDSPGAKMTYSAAVRVPGQLTALMSAVPVETKPKPDFSILDAKPRTQTFYFEQKIPIPPYLLALVVGELESRELSPRTRVWSEPSVVDSAAHEFAETPQFLDAGELFAGEYVWGRYDLLVLPPSFPYGGMENPCLTFVTPTLLAGDRSLANVIIHEICHSWTGNLVTNANHNHFWLNEGWTVFLERKILGHVFGEKIAQFHAANGHLDLIAEVERFGPKHPWTRMVVDIQGGMDPDMFYSKLPYEKGFHFLYFLQVLLGGPTIFEPFMKAYVEDFKLKTLTTNDFKEYFLTYFDGHPCVGGIDWDAWLYSPGLPPRDNYYDLSMAKAPYALAQKWHESDATGVGGGGPAGVSSADMDNWTSGQTDAFLAKLLGLRSMVPMHKTLTRKMANIYGLDNVKNSEIRFGWLKLCVMAEDEAVVDNLVDFLKLQGRMKFVHPLYKAWGASKMGRDAAPRLFREVAHSYHPTVRKKVASTLGISA